MEDLAGKVTHRIGALEEALLDEIHLLQEIPAGIQEV